MIGPEIICIYPQDDTRLQESFEAALKMQAPALNIHFAKCNQKEDIENHVALVATKRFKKIVLIGEMFEETLFSYLNLLFEKAAEIFDEIILYCFDYSGPARIRLTHEYGVVFLDGENELLNYIS